MKVWNIFFFYLKLKNILNYQISGFNSEIHTLTTIKKNQKTIHISSKKIAPSKCAVTFTQNKEKTMKSIWTSL